MTSKESKRPSLLRPEVFIATVGGAGFFPKAPGTAGALVTAIAVFLFGTPLALTLALVLVMAIGTWAAGRYMELEGAHDPGEIVIDEVAGVLVAFETIMLLGYFFGMPLLVPNTLIYVLGIFLLFRLFDIAKPWPVGPIDEKVDGALGVMLDDVVAGIMAGVAWMLIYYIWVVATVQAF
jgi:phosphatidylglycerophosphatase A